MKVQMGNINCDFELFAASTIKPNNFNFLGTELAKFLETIVGFMMARIIKPTF